MASFESGCDDIQVAERGGVLRVTLARPGKRNALNAAMYAALMRALDHAEASDAVTAVLLDAQGETFCAGNDVAEFAAAGADVDVEHGPALTFIRALARLDTPTVAAVAGPAVGIGTTLLLHVDLVVAARSARFSTPFADLGLVPEAGASKLLPRRVGRQNAAKLLLAGAVIEADEAQSMGLIATCVADAELADAARRLAENLAAKPPAALRASKGLLRAAAGDDLDAVLAREAAAFRAQLLRADTQAIIQRLLR